MEYLVWSLNHKAHKWTFVNRLFVAVFPLSNISRKGRKASFEGSLPSVGKADCFCRSLTVSSPAQDKTATWQLCQVDQALASQWPHWPPSSMCAFPLLRWALSLKCTPNLCVYLTDLCSAIAPIFDTGKGRVLWLLRAQLVREDSGADMPLAAVL